MWPAGAHCAPRVQWEIYFMLMQLLSTQRERKMHKLSLGNNNTHTLTHMYKKTQACKQFMRKMWGSSEPAPSMIVWAWKPALSLQCSSMRGNMWRVGAHQIQTSFQLLPSNGWCFCSFVPKHLLQKYAFLYLLPQEPHVNTNFPAFTVLAGVWWRHCVFSSVSLSLLYHQWNISSHYWREEIKGWHFHVNRRS